MRYFVLVIQGDQAGVREGSQKIETVVRAGEAVVGEYADREVAVGGARGGFKLRNLLVELFQRLVGFRAEGP